MSSFRRFGVAVLLGSLLVVPGSASSTGLALYKAKGTVDVTRGTNQLQGYWSMNVRLTLAHTADPFAPASGTMTGSGALGPVSLTTAPNILSVTDGSFTISWAGGSKSQGYVNHLITKSAKVLVVRFYSSFGTGTIGLLKLVNLSGEKYTGYLEMTPAPHVSVYELLCQVHPSRPLCDF